MKRAFAALASAGVLVALLPASIIAAAPFKYTDHSVEAFCEGSFDGGYASASLVTSTQFDDGASADVWLDPAVPFEEAPSLSGSTSTVDLTESATQYVLTATFGVTDANGVELGEGMLTATMAPAGDSETIEPPPEKGNHHSTTHGTRFFLEGSATLTVPGHEIALTGCSGDVTDIDVFETNPHSFTSSAAGLIVDCFWQSDETSASFFAADDDFGLSFSASLTTPDVDMSGSGAGTLTTSSVTATIPLTDFMTGDPHTATTTATLTPIGNPVTSTYISANARTRSTEQAFAASGTIDFDTGDSFVLDPEHCRASSFNRHSQSNVPAGPKSGPTPVNDVPDGAIRLTTRSRQDLRTGSTAIDPEVPNVTCPEGPFDAMGHTVWYTILGTGHPITVDTSGSDFDTVAAAYRSDQGGFTEVACTDDVEFVPIGASYQAVLTFDTEVGAEYYVQVGGYQNFFSGDTQSGRLRLTVR